MQTATFCTYNNNEPWFNNKLWNLLQAKEEAYRNGERHALYKQARNTLTRESQAAKRSYSEKLKSIFSASHPASVWRGLQDMINTSPHPVGNKQLAEELYSFYCQFLHPSLTPLAVVL